MCRDPAMLHTVVDPKAVAIQMSIYICACVSYSTEDEEVEDDWTICLIWSSENEWGFF